MSEQEDMQRCRIQSYTRDRMGVSYKYIVCCFEIEKGSCIDRTRYLVYVGHWKPINNRHMNVKFLKRRLSSLVT